MGILLVYDVTDEKSFNSMCIFTAANSGRSVMDIQELFWGIQNQDSY